MHGCTFGSRHINFRKYSLATHQAPKLTSSTAQENEISAAFACNLMHFERTGIGPYQAARLVY